MTVPVAILLGIALEERDLIADFRSVTPPDKQSLITDLFEIARIALLKLQPAETRLRSSPIPCCDQIPGNVDSQYFSPHEG